MVAELRNRPPVRIARIVHALLRFSPEGVPDRARTKQETVAVLSEAFFGPHPEDEAVSRVVGTTIRFMIRGGRWQPDADLARAIHDAVTAKTRVWRLW